VGHGLGHGGAGQHGPGDLAKLGLDSADLLPAPGVGLDRIDGQAEVLAGGAAVALGADGVAQTEQILARATPPRRW